MSDIWMRKRRLESAQYSTAEAVSARNISTLPTVEVSSQMRYQDQIKVGSEPSSIFEIRMGPSYNSDAEKIGRQSDAGTMLAKSLQSNGGRHLLTDYQAFEEATDSNIKFFN
ncbi:hypothetical protein EVAR_36813_1 [Eumeta japonica]|uniref:Uncharacterized protein n=1 Tax=Eumeta variegata TaxID=151549 RepID=A0A4C1WWG2_EUMVA|nr:hypothetical protein EVAR_36813_1 [Eumeta japonica]